MRNESDKLLLEIRRINSFRNKNERKLECLIPIKNISNDNNNAK